MLAIPIKSDGKPVLILILQKENMIRMQQADPIDIDTAVYLGAGPKLVIAYEENDGKLAQLARRGNLKEIIEYVERGRTVYEGEVKPPEKWKPE